jgi:hypothetical protein
VTTSRRPTRATVEGRAYLDLQNLARRQQRPTDELHQLYALEGFLARLARSPDADRLVLKGDVLLLPTTRAARPATSTSKPERSPGTATMSYNLCAASRLGLSTMDSSSTPTPPRQTSSATTTITAASASP